MKRVLPLESVPVSLWEETTLLLPEPLAAAYCAELKVLGLWLDATKGTEKKDIHGGCSIEETLEHFTHRFGVSAGRLEFVALAPDDSLSQMSDAILSTFSDGHVALLDIPCGTGTSLGALLMTLVRLRELKLLPSLPLTISVVGGDCSEKALEIYDSMLARLTPVLEHHAIVINFHLEKWDATRSDQTASLVDHWFKLAEGAEEYFVCVSNFSGALIGAGLLEDFKPCLEQILGRLYDKKSTLLWIEPSRSEDVQKKLIPRIKQFFVRRISWFHDSSVSDAPVFANYSIKNPVDGYVHTSGVEVQRFDRG